MLELPRRYALMFQCTKCYGSAMASISHSWQWYLVRARDWDWYVRPISRAKFFGRCSCWECHSASSAWAVQRMSLHDALAVFWTAPLLVIAIAAMTRGQSGGVPTLAATVIGLIGALLICKPSIPGSFVPVAMVFGLGMAVCLRAHYMVDLANDAA